MDQTELPSPPPFQDSAPEQKQETHGVGRHFAFNRTFVISLLCSIIVGTLVFSIQQYRINKLVIYKPGYARSTPVPTSQPPLRLISPREAGTFCIGEKVPIEWEGSTAFEYITVYLEQPSSYATIGEFPVSFTDGEVGSDGKGRYTWPAGEIRGGTSSEGYTYRIFIQGRYTDTLADGTKLVESVTDRPEQVFTLKNCGTE